MTVDHSAAKIAVWVVYGDDHDYDCMSQWLVGAYETQDAANAAAEADRQRYLAENGSDKANYSISETTLTLGANTIANAVREQERNAVIERAEQACRYALKRQEFCDSSPGYRDGWETAAEVCEAAIRPHVERHTKDGVTT